MQMPYQSFYEPGCPSGQSEDMLQHGFFRKASERRELKQRGLGVGLALIGMVIFPVIISTAGYFLMETLGFVDMAKYSSDYMYMKPEVYYLYYAALYLGMVLLPFVILIPSFRMSVKDVCPLGRTVPGKTQMLAAVSGLAVCMVSNTVTSGWCTMLEGVFGVVSVPGELPMDDSFVSRVLYFSLFAILPPIAEELAFRGVVFGLLRPYGKTIAVVGSAFVFGIMHGNLLQIPFAFLGGLFFGYLVAETGSILPAVILHFMNNGMSVVQEFLLADLPENVSDHLMYIFFIAVIIVGCISLLELMRRNKNLFRMEEDRDSKLSNTEKFRAFACHPAMIVSYLIIGLEMIMAMKFTG